MIHVLLILFRERINLHAFMIQNIRSIGVMGKIFKIRRLTSETTLKYKKKKSKIFLNNLFEQCEENKQYKQK